MDSLVYQNPQYVSSTPTIHPLLQPDAVEVWTGNDNLTEGVTCQKPEFITGYTEGDIVQNETIYYQDSDTRVITGSSTGYGGTHHPCNIQMHESIKYLLDEKATIRLEFATDIMIPDASDNDAPLNSIEFGGSVWYGSDRYECVSQVRLGVTPYTRNEIFLHDGNPGSWAHDLAPEIDEMVTILRDEQWHRINISCLIDPTAKTVTYEQFSIDSLIERFTEDTTAVPRQNIYGNNFITFALQMNYRADGRQASILLKNAEWLVYALRGSPAE